MDFNSNSLINIVLDSHMVYKYYLTGLFNMRYLIIAIYDVIDLCNEK